MSADPASWGPDAPPGHVLRYRPPGGLMTPRDVTALAEYATPEAASLRLEPGAALTVVHPPGAVVRREPRLSFPRWAGGGWHVLCSPLTGRAGGIRDVRGLAERVSREVPGTPRPAAARREPLIAVDDGRRDLAGTSDAVLALVARDDGGFTLEVFGVGVGAAASGPQASRACAAAAEMVDAGADAEAVARGVAHLVGPAAGAGVRGAHGTANGPAVPIGWIDHDGDDRVTLGAAVADGDVDPRRWEFVAAVGCPVVIGPHGTVLLCDLDAWTAEQVVRVFAPLGFVFDAGSTEVRELGISCAPPSPGSGTSAEP